MKNQLASNIGDEQKSTNSVKQQILDEFIKKLEEDGVDIAVIKRLKVAVAADSVSDTTIKKALFTEDIEL